MPFARRFRARRLRFVGVAGAIFAPYFSGIAAAPRTLTSFADIYQLPETEAHAVHPVRVDTVVYYYDPAWRVAWGRAAGIDSYFTLAGGRFELAPGDHVLIEGNMTAAKGPVVEDAVVTVLGRDAEIDVIDVHGEVGDTERLDHRVVAMDGYVDRQVRNDSMHTELDLIVPGHVVSARVLSSEPPPNLEGALVHVRGVYSSTTDPAGGPAKIELWVQGKQQVSVVGRLDADERFAAPVIPIEQVATAAARWVHLVGTLRSQQPGASLTIRDGTGQIVVQSLQSARFSLGETIEVIAAPTRQGGITVLREGLYRRATTPPLDLPQHASRLRLAEQVRDLSSDEAARHYPVQLRGVVTWSSPTSTMFYIQDVSGGACIVRPPDTRVPSLGWRMEISGTSELGSFAPVVIASSMRDAGAVDLPEARPVTLEQAFTGVEEGQWVAISGYVRDVSVQDEIARLRLTTSGGEFDALVPATSDVNKLSGSVVRLRGVCCAVANRKRQLEGIELRVPAAEYIELEEAAPTDVFSVPMRTVASLRQFGSLHTSNRRVRVAGVALSQSPGRLIRLQDGTDGLLVLSRQTTLVSPGDHVEVVGFPGRENSRLVLREATFRKTGGGDEPKPQNLASVAPPDLALDGRLVSLRARLLEISDHENGSRLLLREPKQICEALIDLPKSHAPRDWSPGALLSITGIYVIEFDEYHRPDHVRLDLRSAADVVVLDRASWWTTQRILAVTALLALAAVAGLAGVIALRHRVLWQKAQIHDQTEKEKAARLEAVLARASKLESLGLLAGGIAHDFNNLLTVILCNLSLARLDRRISAETENCLRDSERATARARDLTQQLLTFAKGGAPVRASTRLPEVVKESAQFALHGSRCRCEFDITSDLWPANVDKGQIAQVVQNIVINATQAMPQGGTIRVALQNVGVAAGTVPALAAGRYLKLVIADEGHGIAPEILPRIFDPYFTTKQQGSGLGLATVYSIVRQHHGHVEVESEIDAGTRFIVWLPAADGDPVAEAPTVQRLPSRQGRVLFMDDEPSIRTLGEAVLRRMGLTVTTVAHGQAVLDACAAAAAAGHRYDLLVLDLTVPGGMGGHEALQKLRQSDPNVRAIVSSGYSSDPVMADYRAHGFAAVVVKPYEAAQLARTVDAVMAAAVAVSD